MITVATPEKELQRTLEAFASFENKIGDFVFEAAVETKKRIQERVQNNGMATNGSYLVTRSKSSMGRYSEIHGNIRLTKGLQVDVVDLTLTGQMWNSYGEEQSGNETKVFFDNDEASAKAAYSENHFETVIFEPSEPEFDNVDRMADIFVEKFLNGL